MAEVDIFIPCFIDQMFPETAWNMIKVLEKLDCRVHYNPAQTCCGQPAWNGGLKEQARPVCQKWIDDFSSGRYIVTPSGSCAGMVRGYYHEMFQNTSYHKKCKTVQSKLFEFGEFLTDVLKVEDLGATLKGKATYHDACGALRECGIKESPRKLLKHVNGLELIEMNECETCCGFGGTFSVKYEQIAVAMAEQKVANALATGAEYMISTDTSCLMHVDGYIKKNKIDLKVMHLADVLVQGW